MQPGAGRWDRGETGGTGEYRGARPLIMVCSCPAAAAMEPAPGPQEKYQLITRNLQVPGGGWGRGWAGGTSGDMWAGSEGRAGLDRGRAEEFGLG